MAMWEACERVPKAPPELADKATLTPEEAAVFREAILKSVDVDKRAEEKSVDIEGAYNFFWFDWGTELHQDLQTSLIIDPPNGRLPAVTPEARARMVQQNRQRSPPVRDLFSYSADVTVFRPAGPESLGLSERCLVGLNAGPPLNPGSYNNNLRIVQTPTFVVLVTEMIHDARVVPMDGRQRLPPEINRWSGDSRGHWDGNTLVVETTNFTDKRATFQLPATLATIEQSGAVGSGAGLHLVERFTPVSDTRLDYEYTITAPATFVAPFTVNIPMKRSDARVFEYACHEGNYAVPAILKGARLLEAESADKVEVLKVGRTQ